MWELRAHGRRASCLARYRHGGLASLYPQRMSPVQVEMAERSAVMVEAAEPAGAVILPFRAVRAPARPAGARTDGRAAHRRPPKKPRH